MKESAEAMECLGYFKIVITSDHERVIRSMERIVVESLFEDYCKELRGCQVVM